MSKRLVVRALQLLRSNPQLFLKRVVAEVRRIQPLPRSRVWKRINNRVLFEFDFTLDPTVGAMYRSVYEMSTVESMKKLLKDGDVFIDVGANIGYLSAVALTLVGQNGQVHSFEPVPEYFEKLQNLTAMNQGYRIVAIQCALGETEGIASITTSRLSNVGWNTMVVGFMSRETVREEIEVRVQRLDKYIQENDLRNISLIKIDTEGFEFPVLKGLSDYFENSIIRPPIICEIAPAAYPLLECTLIQLQEFMTKYNYVAVSLDDFCTPVDVAKLKCTTTVVFRLVE